MSRIKVLYAEDEIFLGKIVKENVRRAMAIDDHVGKLVLDK